MNVLQNAILAWKSKKLTNPQLLRALVSYDKWNLPVSEAAAHEMLSTQVASKIQFSQAPDGAKTLLLYTDSESYTQSLAGRPQPASAQHFLTTTGTWIFQLPLESFSAILINPGTPTALLYIGAQIDGLRETSMALIVEDFLVKLRQGTGPDGSVRTVGEYRAFSFAVSKINDQNIICFAPDNKQRKLIAVFTTDDAYDDYVNQLPDDITSTMFQVRMAGPELFPLLQRQIADGLVFNCCGPTNPVAFAMGLCAVVIGELNSAPPTTS